MGCWFPRRFMGRCNKWKRETARFVVDAKSIMGIFSLNISEPVELVLSGEEEDVEKAMAALSSILV